MILPPLLEPAFPIVVSGPSGVGKTVLCRRLLRRIPFAVRAVTATTRPPRGRERPGRSYFYYDRARFLEERDRGGLAEWAEVHGHFYGTPRPWLEQKLREGRCVVLNIDVQGGPNLRRVFPEALLIFIMPPSLEVLEERLRQRATDTPEEIARRLQRAVEEMKALPVYDYVVVNQTLSRAASELAGIVRAERARVARCLVAPARA